MGARPRAFDGTARPDCRAPTTSSGGGNWLTLDSRGGFVGATTPGGPVTIWYLEDGFETIVPREKRTAYQGREPNRQLVQPVAPATRTTAFVQPDQIGQLRNAFNLAYCQPAVGAIFNFQLADEVQLGGWQSGLLWADGTPEVDVRALHPGRDRRHRRRHRRLLTQFRRLIGPKLTQP